MKTGEPVESLSLSKILVLYMRKYLFKYIVIFRHCIFRISEFMHFVKYIIFELIPKENNITLYLTVK